MDRDMRDHTNPGVGAGAGKGTGTGHEQQRNRHHNHVHRQGRCPDAMPLAEPTSSNQQLLLPAHMASTTGENVGANVNNNLNPLRPTRVNRPELSTFLAHCNVTGRTIRTGDGSDSKKVN